MTLQDLAKLTNFSVSTISKAFNNAPDISDETKRKIYAAAKQYGIFGKYYKGKYYKKIIAIVCPELRSNYYILYVEKLKNLIEENDGIAIISTYDFEKDKMEEIIEYYSSYLGVDGIFVFYKYSKPKKGCDKPLVSLLAAPNKTTYIDSVCVDSAQAIFEAVAHLKSLGHKRMGFLGELLTFSKKEEFIDAAVQNGYAESDLCILTSNLRFEEAGIDNAEKILTFPEIPTAVICGYDSIAMGFIKGMSQKGYRVPEDISVIGMDNIASCEYMNKALSSIDSGCDEVCRMAMDVMKKKLDNEYFSLTKKISLQSKLILRDTTAPPPKS
ncbi:MAG: LacI family DNA-binding transcriptional regulator [Clostridia bacterium]|nr:LacI family DNA-binding transcriptional regulator [Clostridia bacterium]